MKQVKHIIIKTFKLTYSAFKEGSLVAYTLHPAAVHRVWSLTAEEMHLVGSVHQLALAGSCAVVADYSGNVVTIGKCPFPCDKVATVNWMVD